MSLPVVIIGGGTIGLSIAWSLVRRGCAVTLLERDSIGRGTSWVAGGMLAPDSEINFEEPALYRLNRESLRRWPGFVDELEADTGHGLGFRTEGTLSVADDRDSAEALHWKYVFQKERGLDVEWLSEGEARDLEPFLAPRLTAAVYSPHDYQVNNRAVIEALRVGIEKHGGILHEHTPVRTLVEDALTPAVITEGGDRIEGRHVVVAAGAWSRKLDGLEPDLLPPVRPVRGQIIDLYIQPLFGLRHVVRAPSAYLVPKADGRLLLGATSEEMGFDEGVTAGGIYQLIESARKVVPGIDDLTISTIDAGLRPGSRDNAPLLGPSGAPGITYATGHYRHGILLTPITAEEISRFILEDTVSEWLEPFLPTRFAHAQTY